MTIKNSYKQLPNDKGYFGDFGGRYVSETLMPLILEVEKEYYKIKSDIKFKKELNHYMETYIGRPSPLFFAQRITQDLRGPKIYFKRDELNHRGAHKINDYKKIDYYLFDYKPDTNELPGGNSKTFDWRLLKNKKIGLPWFISGGVDEYNIKNIQRIINPNGIDLSSGVEEIKGIKSNQKIDNLFKRFYDN